MAAARVSPTAITVAERACSSIKAISPITHVKKNSAPALIIHGDKDKLVPIQQAEVIGAKYKEVGVPFELVVKKGGDHGWADIGKDIDTLGDWFDKHLQKK